MLHQPRKSLSIESALGTGIQVRNSAGVFGRVEVLVELVQVGKGDAGAEVAGVFALCIFAVLRRLENGKRLERIGNVSDYVARHSLLSLGRSPNMLINLLPRYLGPTFPRFKVHRHGVLACMTTLAEGALVVSFGGVFREAVGFEGGEGTELPRTVVAFVILWGFSTSRLSDRSWCGSGRLRSNGDKGYTGACLDARFVLQEFLQATHSGKALMRRGIAKVILQCEIVRKRSPAGRAGFAGQGNSRRET